MQNSNPAVVVGLCVHGIAIVRALAESGIQVYAFEKDETRAGSYTRFSNTLIVSDINGDGLISSLIETGKQLNRAGKKPVLFLSNDTMVRVVGQNWHKLKSYYLMSWDHCIDLVLKLQKKDEIEKFSNRAKINYPKSWDIDDSESPDQIGSEEYPIIVKPVQPLSAFKTLVAKNHQQLSAYIDQYSSDLPFIAQQWIPGDDKSIFFCALYLEKGKELAHFVGQKILSHPPARGQTLVAIDSDNEDVYRLTRDFFEGLGMSGPVSLELKVDDKNRYWVIEPTVGRTDFWADLPIQCGVNLPLIEYRSALNAEQATQKRITPKIWFDTEKDRFAYFRLLLSQKTLRPYKRPAVFPYFGMGDKIPFFAAISSSVLYLIRNKIVKPWRSRNA